MFTCCHPALALEAQIALTLPPEKRGDLLCLCLSLDRAAHNDHRSQSCKAERGNGQSHWNGGLTPTKANQWRNDHPNDDLQHTQ
jgi:hypothetical protein